MESQKLAKAILTNFKTDVESGSKVFGRTFSSDTESLREYTQAVLNDCYCSSMFTQVWSEMSALL